MTRENSPNYVIGAADALEDMAREAEHGGVALGPDVSKLRDPSRPRMYLKGYKEHYAPIEHVCNDQCRGQR